MLTNDAYRDERLFDRVDFHARVRPDTVALEGGGVRITYAELAARARQFAATLVRSGIERGDRVAVLATKSPDLVVAIYGILRAGAAYVPLSTEWPADRAEWVIGDVGAKAVVADLEHVESIHTDRVKIFHLANAFRAEPQEPEAALGDEDDIAAVLATDLAYVIYTSGSTGNPKGVMHSHRSGLAFVRWAAAELALTPEDRLASHAPFQFDLSIFDIYAASYAGGALVIPDDGTASVPPRFIDWIEEKKISIVYTVPGVWVAGLGSRAGKVFEQSTLRRILYAGEPMAVKFVALLQQTFPNAPIYNFYGPTETNVCTAYRVPRLDPNALPAAIPIGVACSDDRVRTEEEELIVEGESLLLGYWGKPLRSAGEPYRTGDIVRWDEALGGYVFVGRRDGMRKIRGFRIELGEVEACLLRSPATAEVVATVDERDPSHPVVVAFVVAANAAAKDAMELKRHCARFLPPYMVPRIVWRDSLPRTTTGKTDRRALDRELFAPQTDSSTSVAKTISQ